MLKRQLFTPAIFAMLVILSISCADGKVSPTVPSTDPDSLSRPRETHESHTNLWGLYDVSLNSETGQMDVVVNRGAEFTANVVNFINSKSANLKFSINGIIPGADYIDVHIDISITHPFPGLPQYNGYDVRGVFMGDGSAPLGYGSVMQQPVKDVDQFMLPAPLEGPDGYTRWYNATEFSEGGMPLFQYTPGHAATPGYLGTATINPYKYFADGLDADDNLFSWLVTHADQNGRFSSGATNTRLYYIRFPNSKGIKFAYAIIADWNGPEEENHPANAPEAVALQVDDQSTVWYTPMPPEIGGDIKLDISVWDWDAKLTSTVMEDYLIYMRSDVFTNEYVFSTSEMTPVGGTENYSTYHVEIPATYYEIGSTNHKYWIIVEEQDADYTNQFGSNNLAWDEPLAAFFRYDLDIASGPTNTPPVINGITDDIDPDGLNQQVTDKNTAVTYSVDYTDPDLGQTHTIDWYIEDASATDPSDPPDALPYDWSTVPIGEYKIWVTVDDGIDAVTGGPWDIAKVPMGWVKTWGAGNQDRGYGLIVDSQQNIIVCGNFYSNCDFDPDPVDTDWHNSGGNRDSFISKFDPTGDFLWARTWGGNVSFGGGAMDVKIDSNDNIYVGGYWYGTCDFDPDPVDEDIHFYHEDGGDGDGGDAYLSKFDPDGDFVWAKTWGGYDWLDDTVLGVAVDQNDDVYVTGGYLETVDFDPGPGETILNSQGGYRDIYISKFNPSGDFQWVQAFGGPYDDYSFGMTVDLNNDVYFTGRYYGDCDFDTDPVGEEWYNSNTDGNMFMTKYDIDGNYQYVKIFGPGDAFRLAVNSSNDIVLSGVLGGTAQFDTDGGTAEIVANGTRDCFLNSWDESGTWLWVKTWDSIATGDTTSGYIGHHVFIDDDDYIHSTAHFTGTADLDPDPVDEDIHISNGLRDIFVSKFDPSGDFIWARSFGAESTDDGGGIGVDSDGNVYSTGWYYGNPDFDPGPDEFIVGNNGSLDCFLLKLHSDGYW